MKYIASALFTILLQLCAAEPIMNHAAALSDYVQKLNT